VIDEVVVTAANVSDRDAVDDLLAPSAGDDVKPEVLGDCAYADGETRDRLGGNGYTVRAKVPPIRNRSGRFGKTSFNIDLADSTVTCPAGMTVTIASSRRGGGKASFSGHCQSCPMRKRCTAARDGRSITIHRHEAILLAARAEQTTPEWVERYRADRPIVERKIALDFDHWYVGGDTRCCTPQLAQALIDGF
jgi:hypothetical protein